MKQETLLESAKVAEHAVLESFSVCIYVCRLDFVVIRGCFCPVFAKIQGSDVCLRLFVPNCVLLLAAATRRHVQPNTLQTKRHHKNFEEIFSPLGILLFMEAVAHTPYVPTFLPHRLDASWRDREA